MKKLMKVEGMHCGGCSGRLKRILEALPGVTEALSLIHISEPTRP